MVGASILKSTDPEATERIVRVAFGGRGYVLPIVPADDRTAFLARLRDQVPLLACSTLNEVQIDYLIKPTIDERYSAFFTAMEAASSTPGCRLEVLKLAQRQAAKDPWGRIRDTAELATTGYDLPFARQLSGIILLSMSTQNFLGRYDKATQ